MSGGGDAAVHRLCRLEDIPDGGSAVFRDPKAGAEYSLMSVRRDGRVFVYVNSCPHIGAPLDFVTGRFLNVERTHILCSNHGALFRIEDGHCVDGPCRGDSLEAVAALRLRIFEHVG